MKQKEFLFVDIISSIFLLLILFSNFLGLIYITNGSITLSVVISIVIVIFYYFLVDQLKKNKEQLYKNKLKHFSSLFILIFLGLSLISFSLTSHFLNIEFYCKDAIKQEANHKLDQVVELVDLYKDRSRKDMMDYQAILEAKLTAYKDTPDDISLWTELSQRPYDIDKGTLDDPENINVDAVSRNSTQIRQTIIDNNITALDSTVSKNENMRSVFNNWKRMSLMATYDELNKYVKETQVKVDEKLASLPINKELSYIDISDDKLPLDSPSMLNKKFPPSFIIPFITILITHIFILIPFFSFKIRGYVAPNIKKQKGAGSSSGSSGSIEI